MPTTPEMASLPGYQSYQHSAEIGGGVGVVACLPRLGLLLVWESAISIEVLKRTAARAWRVWGRGARPWRLQRTFSRASE